jgi:hypothetical protein
MPSKRQRNKQRYKLRNNKPPKPSPPSYASILVSNKPIKDDQSIDIESDDENTYYYSNERLQLRRPGIIIPSGRDCSLSRWKREYMSDLVNIRNIMMNGIRKVDRNPVLDSLNTDEEFFENFVQFIYDYSSKKA